MFFFIHERAFIQLMLFLCCLPLISLFPPISLNRRNKRRKRRMMTRMSTPRLPASTSSFLRTLATSTSSGPTSTRPEICMAVMSQGFQVCVGGRGVSLCVGVSGEHTVLAVWMFSIPVIIHDHINKPFLQCTHTHTHNTQHMLSLSHTPHTTLAHARTHTHCRPLCDCVHQSLQPHNTCR